MPDKKAQPHQLGFFTPVKRHRPTASPAPWSACPPQKLKFVVLLIVENRVGHLVLKENQKPVQLASSVLLVQ